MNHRMLIMVYLLETIQRFGTFLIFKLDLKLAKIRDNSPKTKRKSLKKIIHSSKKVLSEEFDIEENVPESKRRRKLGGKGDNTKLEDRTDNKEPNFNTAAYHKKQHEI